MKNKIYYNTAMCENSKIQNRLYSRYDVSRKQKYTEQNQTEHGQVQYYEHVVHVTLEDRTWSNDERKRSNDSRHNDETMRRGAGR